MFGVLKKIFSFAGTRKSLLTKSIIISFIGAAFSALQFAALMLVLNALVTEKQSGAIIWQSLGIMLVSIAGKALCAYLSNLKQTEVGYHMVAEKRVHIGDRLRYIPMGYFNQNSLGNITAVVTTTLGDVENSAARALVAIFGGLLTTFAYAIALMIVDVRIGLIAVATVALYLLVTEASQKASEKAGPKRQKAQETLVEAVLEYVQGMSVVKSYGLSKDGGQTVQKAIDNSHDKNLKLEYTACPWMGLQQLIVRLGSIGIAIVALAFYLEGDMNLANCLMMLISSFLVFANLESAGNMSAMLQMLGHSMDKADSIDDTPVMDIDGKDIVAKDASIVFDNVSFSYGDKKILDRVDLKIPAKTTTAIVGPSGGGKTTMCNLVARFWDTDSGRILLGGTDVKDYKLDSLMQNISMVFQNVYLFQDTIENNIKFGKQDATHKEVVEAAKKACCHDFISQLPDGYDTVIGEGGGSLSGGEKQRISIARAMLKDAPIILLDEATASVDPENEAELQHAIEALTHDKTIVMIAHRLKTVRHADQIVVLSGGHIVEQGTHEQLEKQNGIYSEFLHAREEAIGWKLA